MGGGPEWAPRGVNRRGPNGYVYNCGDGFLGSTSRRCVMITTSTPARAIKEKQLARALMPIASRLVASTGHQGGAGEGARRGDRERGDGILGAILPLSTSILLARCPFLP